jgi:hypothetical protein
MTRQLARAMPRAETCFLLIDNKYLNIRAGRWQMGWQLHTLPIGDDGSGWQSGFGLSAYDLWQAEYPEQPVIERFARID